jgi:4-aminobutyrate aminotransferase-like enzyme
MGCAAALANLDEIERLDIPRIAREREERMSAGLHAVRRAAPAIVDVRGRGMLWALECRDATFANAVVARALQRGLLLLQAGMRGEAITFAPPPVIDDAQLERAFALLTAAVAEPVCA